MRKPNIVIADEDCSYIAALENKFVEELGDKAEIEIITEKEYFNTYFGTPRTVEIMAVSEKMYSNELLKHDIANLFVLTDELENGATQNLSIENVYKYTGMAELFNELVYKSRSVLYAREKQEIETKVIALYAASGGTGKTLLGMGLAKYLANNHKKVFYLNTESIQSFGGYLKDASVLTMEAHQAMALDDKTIYRNMGHFFRNEGFSYLPPFGLTLSNYNMGYKIYEYFIQGIKQSREYEYVIVDVDAGFADERLGLLQMSDYNVVVMKQDMSSVLKTEVLLRCIALQDSEKTIFVCNQYDESTRNYYLESELRRMMSMTEYIERVEEADIDKMIVQKGMQKLAYLFME